MMLLGDFCNITTKVDASVGGNANNSVVYGIAFNAGHAIYKAHFPTEPVTPGVCIVQIAAELLGKHLGCTLVVSGVKNVKFLNVISPISTPQVEYSISDIECQQAGDGTYGNVSFKVVVRYADVVYAKISMQCKRV